MHTILEIGYDSPPAARVGTIHLRHCTRCSGLWAEVRLLDGYPLIPAAEWPAQFDAALVQPGESRTGLHYARMADVPRAVSATRPPYSDFHRVILTRPPGPEPDRQPHLVLGPVALRPAEYAAESRLATFRRDDPFGHDVAVIAASGKRLQLGESQETAECGACFRSRLMVESGGLAPAVAPSLAAGGYRQGHLYLVRTDEPRISTTYQPGVVEVAAEPVAIGNDPGYSKLQKLVFNHAFSAECRILQRGNIGSIAVSDAQLVRIDIESSDHPTIELPPGVYDWYHPWPRGDEND